MNHQYPARVGSYRSRLHFFFVRRIDYPDTGPQKTVEHRRQPLIRRRPFLSRKPGRVRVVFCFFPLVRRMDRGGGSRAKTRNSSSVEPTTSETKNIVVLSFNLFFRGNGGSYYGYIESITFDTAVLFFRGKKSAGCTKCR